MHIGNYCNQIITKTFIKYKVAVNIFNSKINQCMRVESFLMNLVLCFKIRIPNHAIHFTCVLADSSTWDYKTLIISRFLKMDSKVRVSFRLFLMLHFFPFFSWSLAPHLHALISCHQSWINCRVLKYSTSIWRLSYRWNMGQAARKSVTVKQ